MATNYRQQVATLVGDLNANEARAEVADRIRPLVDGIELTPNTEGKLDIDLYGDLAGILTLATKKDALLEKSYASVQQVKVVAGSGFAYAVD